MGEERATVRLVVTGRGPEEISKCNLVLSKVRRALSRFLNLTVLIVTSEEAPRGILIEGETVINCDDEEEAAEDLIYSLTKRLRQEVPERGEAAAMVIEG